MVVGCLGPRRCADHYGSSLLRRACSDVASCRWTIRFPKGSLRTLDRISFWLGAVPDYSKRNCCRSGSSFRKLLRRFDQLHFSGQLPDCATDHFEALPPRLCFLQRVCAQPFYSTTSRRRDDSFSHCDQYAWVASRKTNTELFYVYEDSSFGWFDFSGTVAGMELWKCRLHLFMVAPLAKWLDRVGRADWF